MVDANALRQVAAKASDALDAMLVCCCVVDRGWPAFVFHAREVAERRSALARALTEMTLKVARPIGENDRPIVARTSLFVACESFVYPVVGADGRTLGAIGVGSLGPRRWSSADLRRLENAGKRMLEALAPERRDRRAHRSAEHEIDASKHVKRSA